MACDIRECPSAVRDNAVSTGPQNEGGLVDAYKRSFKKYKSHEYLSTLEKIEKDGATLVEPTFGTCCNRSLQEEHLLKLRPMTFQKSEHEISDELEVLGLRCPRSWRVYDLEYPKGLILIKNPFTPSGQRYWIKQCLLEFPKNPQYITNIDNLEKKVGTKGSCDLSQEEFYKKLRWITFGYHHNWDSKVYSETMKCEFPKDLASLTLFISKILGFQNFTAEAAIVNYYHLDSTLSGHVDKSEEYQDAPLFSISFGQPALFLIGGQSKSLEPQGLILRSGDVAVMSKDSRLSYHGVPRVFNGSTKPWLLDSKNFSFLSDLDVFDSDFDASCNKRRKIDSDLSNIINDSNNVIQQQSSDENEGHLLKFIARYIDKSRVNLNIRQVLHPGHFTLHSSQQ